MRGDRSVRSRGAGWEFVFVAIDDQTRICWSDIHPDERAESAVAFLQATLERFAQLGVRVQRIMTDNGACSRSHAFAALLRADGIRNTRARPYMPRTNEKAERFIRTLQRDWAYVRTYTNSRHRANDLPRYLHDYNFHREHGGIGYQTPFSRLNLGMAIHA